MKTSNLFILLICLVMGEPRMLAQRKGMKSIRTEDLRMHMDFLASDELKGRDTGEPGLEVAARYLAVQARAMGLEPDDADGDFMQPFTIVERTYDREGSTITVSRTDEAPAVFGEPFFLIPPVEQSQVVIEGEIVFAGYGIHAPEKGYDDLEGLNLHGKVVLIMNRGPMNEEGTEARFDNSKWNNMQNFRHKMPYLYSKQPKAVLVVMDPKSGIQSIDDLVPGIDRYLGRSRTLKEVDGIEDGNTRRPRMILIHRKVADKLMARSGRDLQQIQEEIDRTLEPASFRMESRVRIDFRMDETEIKLSNVYGVIRGRDPELQDETVIYVAHYDHVGTDPSGGVFNGADDNASGTVALLEIAEAFMAEKRRPDRSIGFLWVSAEEIGLFGSRYFAGDPLAPIENIATVINLDMVGRRKSEEDLQSERKRLTIVGGDTVKVIGGIQSSVLMQIHERTMEEMDMASNYNYNVPDHPDRYFYRSDHINFARKDIPVLFYSTGTHRDYHRLTDVPERIDYGKFLKMTQLSYKLGYNVARYKGAIEVDNPFSEW